MTRARSLIINRAGMATITRDISTLFLLSVRPLQHISALALAAISLGCSRPPDGPPTQTSEAANDVKAAPTNDQSYALLFADDVTRNARMKLLFDRNGKGCQDVTKTVFRGGFDGTDEWAVTCLDSGTWRVWFKPGAFIDFDQCTKAACA